MRGDKQPTTETGATGNPGATELLLLGAWAPITRAVGLIKAPPQVALDAIRTWKTPLVAEYGATVEVETRTGRIEEGLRALLPLQSPQPDRYLVLPTANPDWTAVYDNDKNGTEPHSLVFSMWDLFGLEAIEVIDVPHTIDTARDRGRYGCTAFVSWGPAGERWIRVMYDGKWGFTNVGDPLPFEDVAAYSRPRVRDRFTRELLTSYMDALGLNPFESQFYCPDGRFTLLRERGQRFPVRHWTLQDARAGVIDLAVPRLS